jgi:hypothetical protein
VAGRHARSREDVLTCRRKRAPLRQIGTTGKLRMARMPAARVGLIQTECFRERAGIATRGLPTFPPPHPHALKAKASGDRVCGFPTPTLPRSAGEGAPKVYQ